MSDVNYADMPWLAHYESGVPETIDYERLCLHEFLDRSARDFPGKTALFFRGFEISFRNLKHLVDRTAMALSKLGVQKGDRVALVLPNIVPCVVAYYAVLRIGGIVVMNNPLYSDRELEHQLGDAGAKVVITLDLLAQRVVTMRPRLAVQHIVYTSIGDYLPFPRSLIFPLVGKQKSLAATVETAKDVHRWKDLISKAPAKAPQVPIDMDDIAMLQYTGGTTGVSKGVVLTHRNLSANVQQTAAWFPGFDRGKETMLGALPFFHVFGLTVAMNLSMYMGWQNILVPKPQPDPLLEAIGKCRPSFAPMVPTMYIGMLNHPDFDKTDLSSLKGCFSGSAPLPLEILKEFEEKTSAVIVEGFGLTEASPVTHINPFAGNGRKPGSIGIPVSDTKARIVSLEDGHSDVPVGETGELLVKGPQIMHAYWNRMEETRMSMDDGWLRTGDIAKMDKDGFFYIVDRKKDMILSSGYNVYPRDVDEVFFEHPKVLEACSIGIPDPLKGEAVKVFVVLKEGENATPEELMAYCESRMATYKLPSEIEFRKELPKSNVGKVLRKRLRAEELEKRGIK